MYKARIFDYICLTFEYSPAVRRNKDDSQSPNPPALCPSAKDSPIAAGTWAIVHPQTTNEI
jgi:hypothetical protein